MINDNNNIYSIPISLAWQGINILNLVYIIGLKNSKFYYFEDVSSEIWNFVVEKKFKQHIIDSLVAKYTIDEDIINNDVTEFLNDLISKKLLKVDYNGN